MDLSDITCPSCFETFSISTPAANECPAELDYDCEICCRPMLIIVSDQGDVYAQSLDEI